MDDERQFIKFYGIEYTDWAEDFGAFSNHTTLLVRDYISDACDTVESSTATDTHKFLYPFHIKKIYFVEGRIEGEICVAASTATSTCTQYRATLCKVHNDTTETELATTGWRTAGDTLGWDAAYSVGDEMVYHFYIDCYEKQTITEEERLYFKVEVQGSNTLVLLHSNDPTWTDVWLKVPFRL